MLFLVGIRQFDGETLHFKNRYSFFSKTIAMHHEEHLYSRLYIDTVKKEIFFQFTRAANY